MFRQVIESRQRSGVQRYEARPAGWGRRFTLIELLVVIAIIGILASLLLRHCPEPGSWRRPLSA